MTSPGPAIAAVEAAHGAVATAIVSLDRPGRPLATIASQRALWERRLDQLDRYLEDLEPTMNPERNKEKR